MIVVVDADFDADVAFEGPVKRHGTQRQQRTCFAQNLPTATIDKTR